MQGYIDFIAQCNQSAANPKELASMLLLDRMIEFDSGDIAELSARAMELRTEIADAYLELKRENLLSVNPKNAAQITQVMNFIVLAGRFATRPYVGLWDFDQVEEMEFRLQRITERAIPISTPYVDRIGQKKVRD